MALFYRYSSIFMNDPQPSLSFYEYDADSGVYYTIPTLSKYIIYPGHSLFIKIQYSLNQFLSTIESYITDIWTDNQLNVYVMDSRNDFRLPSVPYGTPPLVPFLTRFNSKFSFQTVSISKKCMLVVISPTASCVPMAPVCSRMFFFIRRWFLRI